MDKYKNRKKLFFLCGFMACGKTSIGKRTADITGYNFYDTDEMIEKECGMTVREIFDVFGEKKFRDMENEVSKKIYELDKSIISLGGGFILNEGIAEYLREAGYIVYIKRDINKIYDMIREDITRPVAYNKSFEEIEFLHKRRDLIYEKYSERIIINDDIDKSVNELVEYVNRVTKL